MLLDLGTISFTWNQKVSHKILPQFHNFGNGVSDRKIVAVSRGT
jgi:hypothetical protein